MEGFEEFINIKKFYRFKGKFSMYINIADQNFSAVASFYLEIVDEILSYVDTVRKPILFTTLILVIDICQIITIIIFTK